MKPSLQLRLSQQLALTPQLQQSIKLLQLSTLELQQEIEQILADNPLLERLDDPLANAVRLLADGAVTPSTSSSSVESNTTQTEPSSNESTEIEFESSYADGIDSSQQDWGSDTPRNARGEDDEASMTHLTPANISLSAYLHQQLRTRKCSQRDLALISFLIDSLNDDGYLDTDLPALLEVLPSELEIEPEEISAALKLLQTFEPTGVGARNLQECLRLQLSGMVRQGVAERTRKLALLIVNFHLNLLASKDFGKLKRELGCDEEDLRAAQTMITQLNPRPGSAFVNLDHHYVTPDVVVRKVKNQWQAMLNPDVMPKLAIHHDYARTLRSLRTRRSKNSEKANTNPQEELESGTPMQAQLQEARWFIKNIQQRFETILRVSQAIVERQKNFFNHGEIGMRPLVLREIADTLGLHESTISRVTTQKYMLTPFGTFELKYFFGSHIATDSGGAASSTAIRALLKQLIGEENPKKPLSDSQLADLLGEQGYVVARRTVAKYREALRIPPVSLRKSL